MAIQLSRANLLSLYVPAFMLSASNGLVIPALPSFAHSLSISFAQATLALAAQVLGSALAAVPAGYLLDTVGRRQVTITGLIVVALSGMLMTTATSFHEMVLYQLLAGGGAQMWMLGRLTLLSTQSKVEDRGRQVTGMLGMENTGLLLGPAIGGVITLAFGAPATFGVRSVLCLSAAVLVFFATRNAPPAPRVRTEGPPPNLLKILRTPPLPKLSAIQFVVSLTRGSIFYGTLDLYMVYAYGTGPATIGLLRSFVGIVGIPITLTAGHIMDRFGRKATIVPGFVLVTVGLLGMAVVAYAHMPFPYFVGLMIMVMMSISLTSGSMQTMGIDMAPPGWTGRFLGLLRLSTEFGSFLSPMGFGLAVAGLGYPAAFAALASTGAVVAVVVAKWLPDSVGSRRK